MAGQYVRPLLFWYWDRYPHVFPRALRDVLPAQADLTHTPVLSGTDTLSYSKALNGGKPVRQHDYFYWQFNEGGLQEALLQGYRRLIRSTKTGYTRPL